jgi:serine/threonine protein kinase/nucleotide-binding universal stress UspA family protein
MNKVQEGDVVDGFLIERFAHTGGMARVARVRYANETPEPFPMVMKIPRMSLGDGAENIVGFEIELQILRVVQGRHVPRFVAAGDLETLPYLVMEWVEGQSLQQILDEAEKAAVRPTLEKIVTLGIGMAKAAHSLHKQNVCHLDLKPANMLLRPDNSVVMLDFGLSYHAMFPDLMAEELRKAVGSAAWMAPEQVVGVRGDPRSDIFAIGAILYELVTGRLPFGNPSTKGGLRQRMWMTPRPPRSIQADTPEWLQEVILRCLSPEAENRYPSAAHLMFDLSHPDQVKITELGSNIEPVGFWKTFKRWVRAAGMEYTPSPLPARQIEDVPIVLVAIPHKDVTDATLFALRQSTQRVLGLRPGARLGVVTVIFPGQTSNTKLEKSEINVHRRYLSMLKHWAQPLALDSHHISFHVLESDDVAEALLRYAEGNQVSVIVMGAATHGLRLQQLNVKLTVPIKVAMAAPCTVILVKQDLPFEHLGLT